MSRHTVMAGVTLALLLGLGAASPRAGGVLETIDITGNVPSPIAGQVIAKAIGIRWDDRTLPARYVMNTTLNPIPNPLGAPFLSVADAQAVLQQSMNAWNDIPTSYAQMQITGTVANQGVAGFDFKNELTFRTAAAFGAIASSPSVTLIQDMELHDGDRIDLDADSDVSSAITVAADVDGDGDIEYPAGFYKAGTIFDNDVQFNTKGTPTTGTGLRFTIADGAIDTTVRSVDLMAVAVHEFGHSIGLSHTLDNQISAADGTGTTMFPFIDTGDPASELSQRTLGSDDIAWASYLYQEGSAATGLAALQPGDVAFATVYGAIRGEIRHGVLNQPIAGASVAAYDWDTGTFIAAGFSGTTQLSLNPATGGLFVLPVDQAILDGAYTIPVPKGSYAVGIEATDGNPVSAGSISFTAQTGSLLGQLNFDEEFFNNNKESTNEGRPGQRKNVVVKSGKLTRAVDVTTNKNLNINNFGTRNAIGFGGAPPPYYAVRIPAAQITQLINSVPASSKLSLHSMLFDTVVVDASVVPIFAEATLATGSISGNTAAIDLSTPLATVSGFVGQDTDFAPFYLEDGHELAKIVRQGIANGSITDLFMVLKLPPSPFPGISNQPPLIGLDGAPPAPPPLPPPPPNDVPIFGLSYTSVDGVTFTRNTVWNFRFSLGWSELP